MTALAAKSLLCFACAIGVDSETQEKGDFYTVCPQHHIGCPNCDISNVPEGKINEGIKKAGLQSHAACRENGINPLSNLRRQAHIEDHRKNAAYQCYGEGCHHIPKPGRKKQGKAHGCQQAQTINSGADPLQLAEIQIWQIDNGIQHLYGGFRALPAVQAVGHQKKNSSAKGKSGAADQQGGNNFCYGKFHPTIFGAAVDIVGSRLIVRSENGRGNHSAEQDDEKGQKQLVVHGICSVAGIELVGRLHPAV